MSTMTPTPTTEKKRMKKLMSKKKKKRFTRDDFELTLLVLPTALMMLIFAYLPMFGIIIAFKNLQLVTGNFFNALFSSPWAGFDNFKYLFSSNDAFIIIRNTVCYNAVFMIIGIIIPITLAILISQLLNNKLAKLYQTAMLMPYFLSWVVVSGFVYAFLAPGHGLANYILQFLHLGTVDWFTNSKPWPYILTFFSTWKGMGFNTVIYLAAITGIDPTLYEAAIVDGATKFQQAKYITIPGVKTVAVILLILAVGNIFSGDFGLFYLIPKQSGALYNVTEILNTYVYSALSGTGSMGMSAAAAFFQSSVGCFMLVITNLIVRKISPEDALF